MFSILRASTTSLVTRSCSHSMGRPAIAASANLCRSFSSSPSPDQDLLISKSDGLMTIKLNRPSKLNSIKQSMYHDFVSALNSATNDKDVRMVL
jgi:hypothetical protein